MTTKDVIDFIDNAIDMQTGSGYWQSPIDGSCDGSCDVGFVCDWWENIFRNELTIALNRMENKENKSNERIL